MHARLNWFDVVAAAAAIGALALILAGCGGAKGKVVPRFPTEIPSAHR